MEFREGNGKISFELLLPWVDVHPYVGASVEARIERDRGNESPSREGIEMFKQWVWQLLNEE